MKKENELILANKEYDKGSSREDINKSSENSPAKKTSYDNNIYTDTIRALLEKNRGRVSRYYCANRKCSTTFWSADLGYQCPGCGTLRGLHQLLNGNAGAAFRLNPLMMLLLPYVGYSATSSLLEAAGGRPLPNVFIRPVFIWLLLAVIILFWILRNIPYFSLLSQG